MLTPSVAAVQNGKIFMILRGDIHNRLDPTYYELVLNTILSHSKALTSIGSNFYVRDGDHNKLPPEHLSDFENGIRYLRAQDLKNGIIIDEDPIYVSKEYFKSIQRSHITKGALLFSIMASIGSIAVYEREELATANRAIGILLPKPKCAIIPKFLECFFNTNFGINLISSLKKGGIQQRINLKDFEDLKIPKLSIIEQQQIIELYESAYAAKRQKQAEAKQLLASIDHYLLNALGILLPERVEKKKTFFMCSDKVRGNRLDPFYYSTEIANWIIAFETSKYPIQKLAKIAISIFQGIGQNLTEETEFTLLKVKNIRFNNKIDFENVEYVKNVPLQKVLKRGDIITPFIGEAIRQIKFSVFPKTEKKYTVDNNTGIIRLPSTMNPEFISAFLCSRVGSWQIERLIGGGVPFIGSANAGKLLIPIPPLSIQEEIATHITAIRNKAQGLETEAKTIIEAAKQEVEKMILGEGGSHEN